MNIGRPFFRGQGFDADVIVLEAPYRVGGHTLFKEFSAVGRGMELGGARCDLSKQHDVCVEAERYGMTFEPTKATPDCAGARTAR